MKLQKRTGERGRLVRTMDAVRSAPSETPKNVLAEHLSAESYAVIERGLRSTEPMVFLSAFMVLEPFLSPAEIHDLKAKTVLQTRVTQMFENQIQGDLPPSGSWENQWAEDVLDVPREETPEVLELCLRFNPELVNHPSFKRYQIERIPALGEEVVGHFVWYLTRPQAYSPNFNRLFSTRLLFELAPIYQASVLNVIRQPQLQGRIIKYIQQDKPLEVYMGVIANARLISPQLAQTATEQAMNRLPQAVKDIEAVLNTEGTAGLTKTARYLEAVTIISARQASIDQAGRIQIVQDRPLVKPGTPLPGRLEM